MQVQKTQTSTATRACKTN